MFYVIRPPCLMEDEGRTQFCGSFSTRKEAEAHINILTENDTGYFRNSNYKIVSE